MTKLLTLVVLALASSSASATGLPSSAIAGLAGAFQLFIGAFIIVYLIISFFIFRSDKKRGSKQSLIWFAPISLIASIVLGTITGGLLFYPALFLFMTIAGN